MKSWNLFISLSLVLASLSSAFVPQVSKSNGYALRMAFNPPPVQHVTQPREVASTSFQSPLTQGIENYAGTTQLVSLKERVAPTKEEIEEKKRNFNFWFWGGGFVAPFLATFYYFGFKFWER